LAKLALQRATCKLAAEDPQRLELQQEAEKAAVAYLRAPVDVSLPAPPEAALKAAPRCVSGLRKRARAPTPSAEPSVDELLTCAEAEVLQAEKKVKKAERALARAEAAEEEAEKHVMRRSTSLETCEDEKVNMHLRLVNKAEARWMAARLETKEAHIELLGAQLEDSAASLALQELISESALKSVDDMTALAKAHGKRADAACAVIAAMEAAGAAESSEAAPSS
jgi:hypothetical protein